MSSASLYLTNYIGWVTKKQHQINCSYSRSKIDSNVIPAYVRILTSCLE